MSTRKKKNTTTPAGRGLRAVVVNPDGSVEEIRLRAPLGEALRARIGCDHFGGCVLPEGITVYFDEYFWDNESPVNYAATSIMYEAGIPDIMRGTVIALGLDGDQAVSLTDRQCAILGFYSVPTNAIIEDVNRRLPAGPPAPQVVAGAPW